MGSATVPVAVFGVAPKTRQTNLSNHVSGATPETARETRALPSLRTATMPFLTELGNFCGALLQRCQPYGLEKRFVKLQDSRAMS